MRLASSALSSPEVLPPCDSARRLVDLRSSNLKALALWSPKTRHLGLAFAVLGPPRRLLALLSPPVRHHGADNPMASPFCKSSPNQEIVEILWQPNRSGCAAPRLWSPRTRSSDGGSPQVLQGTRPIFHCNEAAWINGSNRGFGKGLGNQKGKS